MRTFLPGWETLSGARVGKRARRVIQVALLLAVLLPTVAVVLGVDLSLGPVAIGPPSGPDEAGRHVVLSLEAVAVGLLGGVLALFVLGRHLGGVDDDLWILAPALLAAAPFALYRAVAAWRAPPDRDLEAVLATAWWLPRMAFVTLLVVGLVVALATRGGSRARRFGTGVLASAALGVAADGIALLASGGVRDFVRSTGEVLVRPLEVVPFGLWLIVGAGLAPTFHRRHRAPLSYGLLAACLPQLVAELAIAFGSLRPFDSAFVLAHGLELAAASVLLAVVVLDQALVFNSHQRARATAAERERQLEVTTARLHRLDLDLLATAERQRSHEASLAALRSTSEAELARRDRILESVAVIARGCLADDWEDRFSELLGHLARATAAERVLVSLLVDPSSPDSTPIRRRWAAEAGPALDDTNLGLPPRLLLFERWRQRLRDGEVLAGAVRDLPDEEREVLAARGVGSYAAVPIFVSGSWSGVLSLEHGDAGRHWSSAEIQALQTAATTIGAAIHRRRAELALAASNAKLSALLETAHDLVQSVTVDGRFDFVNRAWLDALGYSQAEVAELSLWQVIRPDHHARCGAVLEGLIGGAGPTRLETVFVTRSGAEISVEGGVSARRDGGKLIATLGIFRDISERQRVDRMKEEFVSTVSHELRTPLTSIIAALGLVESGQLPEGEARSLLSIAHRNGKRLLDLINDLLDVQKLASGRMDVVSEPIVVQAALEELKTDMAAFADLHQVRIEIDPVEPDLAVLADRGRLRQIFFNLLSNAIKFSPQGERVRLGAASADGCVRFSVTDSGPGIPAEFHARLFEKFARADASSNRRTAGTGLGLSIVKGLTERMGGKIRLAQAPGPGTVFQVDLPRPPSGLVELEVVPARD